jgi:two-component system response regulator DegU
MSKKRSNTLQEQFNLDELDIKVIQLIADEYTQLEMNQILDLPTSTIMYLRRRLFIKMGVKNTAGMVKKALQNRIIQ